MKKQIRREYRVLNLAKLNVPSVLFWRKWRSTSLNMKYQELLCSSLQLPECDFSSSSHFVHIYLYIFELERSKRKSSKSYTFILFALEFNVKVKNRIYIWYSNIDSMIRWITVQYNESTSDGYCVSGNGDGNQRIWDDLWQRRDSQWTRRRSVCLAVCKLPIGPIAQRSSEFSSCLLPKPCRHQRPKTLFF